MQIGINLPWGKGMNGQPRDQVTHRRVKLYLEDVIHYRLSQVDRDMQWAMEMLPLKRGRGARCCT